MHTPSGAKGKKSAPWTVNVSMYSLLALWGKNILKHLESIEQVNTVLIRRRIECHSVTSKTLNPSPKRGSVSARSFTYSESVGRAAKGCPASPPTQSHCPDFDHSHRIRPPAHARRTEMEDCRSCLVPLNNSFHQLHSIAVLSFITFHQRLTYPMDLHGPPISSSHLQGVRYSPLIPC